MKQLLFFFSILISAIPCLAQDFLSNNNGLVSIKDGAFLSVQGDIYLENNAVFDNSDSIFLTRDWINNAGNAGFSSMGEGYVYFIGEDQSITGNDETRFHNLLLRTGGTKFGTLDVFVEGFLDLDFLEFNLDENIVFVSSPLLDAVRNDEGFVSSIEEGGISRNTNLNEAYLFPVGSTLFDTIYRPIEITPTASAQIFRARFADEDATFDGFDREEKALLICDINDRYYHRIWQDLGNDSVDLTFLYKSNIDGTQWNDIVHWEGIPQWEQAPADTLINGIPWDILEVSNWSDFSTPNYALAFTKEPFADAGNDTTIYLLDTIQLLASGGDFYTWTPSFPISCADCPDPLFWDDTTQTLTVLVEDLDNCKDIDTVRITVDERFGDGPFIPSGISPNGDGVNDFWYIRWLYRFPDNEVTILNRWGDVVYKAAPYNNDWYGTYNGNELPEATYYYILQTNEGNFGTKRYTGPITILE